MSEQRRQFSALALKEFVPFEDGMPALKGNELAELRKELGGGWTVIEQHHLEKEYKFRDFGEALGFTNRIGELAESLDHHPDIFLTWGKVKITIWTHKANGLTEGDFVFAAKADMVLDVE